VDSWGGIVTEGLAATKAPRVAKRIARTQMSEQTGGTKVNRSKRKTTRGKQGSVNTTSTKPPV